MGHTKNVSAYVRLQGGPQVVANVLNVMNHVSRELQWHIYNITNCNGIFLNSKSYNGSIRIDPLFRFSSLYTSNLLALCTSNSLSFLLVHHEPISKHN